MELAMIGMSAALGLILGGCLKASIFRQKNGAHPAIAILITIGLGLFYLIAFAIFVELQFNILSDSPIIGISTFSFGIGFFISLKRSSGG